ncbi:MAG: hypothetical protein V1650_03250 [Candidatus Omnitrophota bacterium]
MEFIADFHIPFKSLIPLDEIIADAKGGVISIFADNEKSKETEKQLSLF